MPAAAQTNVHPANRPAVILEIPLCILKIAPATSSDSTLCGARSSASNMKPLKQTRSDFTAVTPGPLQTEFTAAVR
jgi:hypothetical protein